MSEDTRTASDSAISLTGIFAATGAAVDAASEVTDVSYQEDLDNVEKQGGEKDNNVDSGDDTSEECLNPLERLQKRALNLAGLTAERALAIDSVNISHKFDEYVVGRLVELFYERVYSDPDEWFRGIFTSPMDEAVGNLGDYIQQRIGGRPYYSDRKGFPALVQRHAAFYLTPRAAERWLEYMEQALEDDEIEDLTTEKQRSIMLDFLRYTAYYLVASQILSQEAIDKGAHF